MESFELIGMDDETFSSMPRESTPSEDLPRSPLFPPTPPEDEEHVNTNDLRVSTLLDLRNDLHGSRCEVSCQLSLLFLPSLIACLNYC